MMRPDDISPFYHLTGEANCTMMGMEMSQNLVAPVAWMLAIMKHRPSIVIEIGTCKGGLSSLLSRCTATYGGEFHTIDERNSLIYPLYGNATFHHASWESEIEQIKQWITRYGKCFVLCDGGNKPKEFNFFSDVIKVGDVVGVHDYMPTTSTLYWSCSEVQYNDIKDALDRNHIGPFDDVFTFTGWCVGNKLQ